MKIYKHTFLILFLYQERRIEDGLKLMSCIEEIGILAVQVENWWRSYMADWDGEGSTVQISGTLPLKKARHLIPAPLFSFLIIKKF